MAAAKNKKERVPRAGLEVWKFGGASVASAAEISKAAALIARHEGPLVVVVSALAGVTDLLLEGAAHALQRRPVEASRQAAAFLRKHREAVRALFPQGVERRGLLAVADAAAREYRELCAAIGLLGPRTACERSPGLSWRADVGACVDRGDQSHRAPRRIRGRPRDRRDRRSLRQRSPESRGHESQRAPRAASAHCQGHDRRRPRLHRTRAGRQPGDARPRRHRPHRDAAGTRAERPAGRAVEGRPRHPDGRSSPGTRRTADSAAPPSGGRRSRALRRQGAASARADSNRRHAGRAPRAVVPESGRARHRSVGAPFAAGLSGQGARDRARAGDRHRRRQGHGRRPRHRGADVLGGRSRAPLGVHNLSGLVRELDRIHAARIRSRPRGAQHPQRIRRRDRQRAHRQRHVEAGHGGDRGRRRRHGRHAGHRGARVHRPRRRTHQRRRHRAGLVRAQHLVRRQRRRCGGGRAVRAQGFSAVEDRRRRRAAGSPHRRRPARLRPGRPGAGRSDCRAEWQSTVGARRRVAGSLRLHLRAARHLASPAARSDQAQGRRRVAVVARRQDRNRRGSPDDDGRACGVAADHRRRHERGDRRPAADRDRARLQRRAGQQEAARGVVGSLRGARWPRRRTAART